MFFFLVGCVLLESGEIDISVEEQDTSIYICWEDPNCRDADLDGYPEAIDCDDQDQQKLGLEIDLDCDGIVNELDDCELDPFNDLDEDGLCGDEDEICNIDFLIDAENSEENQEKISSCQKIEG